MLFSTRDEVYYGLNEVGALVWKLLSEKGTLDELCARVGEAYPEVTPETIRDDVVELLTDLERHGLVQSRDVAAARE